MIRTTIAPERPAELFGLEAAPRQVLELARHAFEIRAGVLLHYVNGHECAQVPPDGWDDYGRLYPEAESLVRSHRAAERARTPDARSPSGATTRKPRSRQA